ncbi:UMTA methyltransferase [Colletotrichum paranaense]|uniref:UMTA methyltransferase n=1 Tax=Colletotrichum paranaense TaxID=1914294 RepID=A0ABQ9T2G9_9PEZI|nr:UMTA methyltransferase [Colletotrichum paranaense]KAK1545780.1 UMTA methyltransferase [Colletotrichum paranaense]
MAEETDNQSRAPGAPAATAAPAATTPPAQAMSPPAESQASPPTSSPVDTQQVANDVIVEADEGETTDNASTIDERISNYTASLSSSVIDYPMEYGRRYHAFRPGSYIMPNDEVEMERLDMTHAMMVKAIKNRLFLAPLEKEKIQQILDVGTGTGIWAVEIGDIFENAEVIGVDLSAIQPSWVPVNVRFEIDDVESPWVHQTKYDFIFCRFMAASIADWPKLVKNIYDHLNPGGWAEFHEMDPEIYSDDGTYTEKHATWPWNQTFLKTMRSIGREPSPGPRLEGWVKDTGFENIFHQRFKAPLGPWPKEPHYKDLGMLNLAQMLEGLEGFTLRVFCGVLGRTKEEVLVETAQVRKEMKEGAYHGIYDLHVVYGQKPLNEAPSSTTP